MIKRRPKRLKREYLPIIIGAVIFVLLVVALIFVILYKDPNKYKELQDNGYQQEEVIVDNKNSRCSATELEELYKLAKKVEIEKKETKISMGMSVDIDSPGAPEVESFATVFDITLKNMSNDLYVKVTNDFNTDEVVIQNPNDGVFKFQTKYEPRVIKYTIEIKANKYKCADEVIRKFTLVTPVFNIFSEMYTCLDYPEFKYCQEFIYEDTLTYQQFFEELHKYQKETGKTTTLPGVTTNKDDVVITTTKKEIKEDKKNNKNNNIVYIIVSVIVLGVAIVATILIKKRRSRNL